MSMLLGVRCAYLAVDAIANGTAGWLVVCMSGAIWKNLWTLYTAPFCVTYMNSFVWSGFPLRTISWQIWLKFFCECVISKIFGCFGCRSSTMCQINLSLSSLHCPKDFTQVKGVRSTVYGFGLCGYPENVTLASENFLRLCSRFSSFYGLIVYDGCLALQGKS